MESAARIDTAQVMVLLPRRYEPKDLAKRAWIYLSVAIGLLFVGPAVYAALLDDRYTLALAKLPIVLKSAGMAAASILSSHWFLVGLVNLGAAGLWLLAPDKPTTALDEFIHFVNRQLGHIDCAVYSFLAAQAFLDATPHTFAILLAMPIYGTGVMDLTARTLLRNKTLRLWAQFAPEDDLLWVRRPLFYVITAASLIALPQQAPDLWFEMKRLVFVVSLATAIRMLRWIHITRIAMRAKMGTDERLNTKLLKNEKRDWMVLAGVFAFLALPMISLARGPIAFGRDAVERSVQPADCGWRDGRKPEMSLFLIADNQFHHMDGERGGTHLDLVDFVVPVAVRPVALDLLSGATLAHFAERFHKLPETARFAHIGDIADLGCVDELDRFGKIALQRFGKGGGRNERRLAALLPGNHDSTFIGNFFWHPDWDNACAKSKPLLKRHSDEKILEYASPYLTQGARPILIDHPAAAAMTVPRSALPWVSRLGSAGGRDVVGVFIDTSDYTTFVLGIAGTQGGVSDWQMQKIRGALENHPNAFVIIFLHHPFDELSNLARARVTELAHSLDKRVVTMVSAHTHLAALRRHAVGKRVIPELVLGSTTDSPQEAALLEMGRNASGRVTLQFRTLPAVARPGLTCDEDAAPITTKQCLGVVERIKSECGDLYEHWTDNPGLAVSKPAQVKEAQKAQAERLFDCLCRRPDRKCTPPHKDDALDDTLVFDKIVEPLTDRFYRQTDSLANELREELVCLSWAAGVLQAKKREPGWQGPIALRRAFETDGAFGALGVGILVEE